MTPKEVFIDGVRFVPAAEVTPSLSAFRDALLDQFWGEGYRGATPEDAGKDVFVWVYDSIPDAGDDLPTVDEFIEALAAKLAARGV